MPDSTREYLARDGGDAQEILAAAARRWRVQEGPWQASEHRFYDSFDWRLFAAGVAVERQVDPEGACLLWQDLDGDEAPERLDWAGAPGLAEDLPEGSWRDRLTSVLQDRRLLPVVTILSREQILDLFEDDERVARLTVFADRFQDPRSGLGGALKPRLHLEPLSRRAADRQALKDWIAEGLRIGLGLRPVTRPRALLVEGLAAIGRRPGDYSSKLDFRLDGQVRADLGLKKILRHLLATLEVNIPGAKAHWDPEFLHDLRVATRRTRSALAQVKDVLSAKEVARYKAGFAWLQQVTGAARDLDVYRSSLSDALQAMPAALRPHLAELDAFLAERHGAAQRQLAEVLESQDFRRLIDGWRAFLDAQGPDAAVDSEPDESALEPATQAPKAALPLQEVADANIWRLYRRVRDEGRAIGPESPPPELHELRKSSKKLRYLMEFFRRLYPAAEIDPLIRLIKVLLDNLGLFQDLAVQVQFLREAAGQMRREGRADTDTLLAVGALIGDLLRRQQAARMAFADTFARFDAKPNRMSFRRLFKPRR